MVTELEIYCTVIVVWSRNWKFTALYLILLYGYTLELKPTPSEQTSYSLRTETPTPSEQSRLLPQNRASYSLRTEPSTPSEPSRLLPQNGAAIKAPIERNAATAALV